MTSRLAEPGCFGQTMRSATTWLSERRRFRGILRRPYLAYKEYVLGRSIHDDDLLDRFRYGRLLPNGYGVGIDERCIEFPWMFSQLNPESTLILDAGSALNHKYMITSQSLRGKTLHILTLAPESKCFWRFGISYLFADLRDVPVRDNYYDTVACISTLEHVGCDNSSYTGESAHRENRPDDVLGAMQELARVLRPGGSLLLTVPFGRYRHLGWMRNFDIQLLARTLAAFTPVRERTETFYCYQREGWQISDLRHCSTSEYADYRSAAGAVACVRLVKA